MPVLDLLGIIIQQFADFRHRRTRFIGTQHNERRRAGELYLLLLRRIPDPRHRLHLNRALDFKARLAALEETNAFENIEYRAGEWPLVLTAEQTVALYATYSPISIRPDRDELLTELRRIAREQFKDRVIRDIVTCLYIARKKCY